MSIFDNNSGFTNFVSYILPILAFLLQLKEQFKEKNENNTLLKKVYIENNADISHIQANNGGQVVINIKQSNQITQDIVSAYNDDYIKKHTYSIRKTQKVFSLYYCILWLPLLFTVYRNIQQLPVLNFANIYSLFSANSFYYVQFILVIIQQLLLYLGVFSVATAVRYGVNCYLYTLSKNLTRAIVFFFVGCGYFFSRKLIVIDTLSAWFTNFPVMALLTMLLISFMIYKLLFRKSFQRILLAFHLLRSDIPEAHENEIRETNLLQNTYIILPIIILLFLHYYLQL